MGTFFTFLLVYLTALAFFLKLGAADFSDALTFGGKLTGVFLLAAGVFLFVATVGFTDYASAEISGKEPKVAVSGLLAMGGAVLIFAGGVFMVMTQVGSGDPDKRVGILGGLHLMLVVVWAVYLVLSLWMVHYLYRTGIRLPSPRQNRGVAIATVATASVAVGNFAYSQVYQPYAESPIVQLSASYGQPSLSSDGRFYELPIMLDAVNIGRVGANILGSNYILTSDASYFVPNKDDVKAYRDDIANGYPLMRYSQEGGAVRVLKSEEYLVDRLFLNPDEHARSSTIVQFPRDLPLGHLRLNAYLLYGRMDRFTSIDPCSAYSWRQQWNCDEVTSDLAQLPPPSHRVGAGGADYSYGRFRTRLRENNALWELVRKPRYVNVWWEIYPNVNIGYSVQPADRQAQPMDSALAQEVADRYGIVWVDSGTVEMAIPR